MLKYHMLKLLLKIKKFLIQVLLNLTIQVQFKNTQLSKLANINFKFGEPKVVVTVQAMVVWVVIRKAKLN